MAAEYFIEKENLFILDEDQKIRLVIQRLGLNSIAPFNPKERIIEYIIRDREGQDDTLISMELKDLIKHIASRTLVPGGSCVTSLVATLGTALSTMCALLTYGMRKVTYSFEQKMIIPISVLVGIIRKRNASDYCSITCSNKDINEYVRYGYRSAQCVFDSTKNG
jgi:glutamate formiminotransferase/formiminotetrahydrofolate cyclodeaminase